MGFVSGLLGGGGGGGASPAAAKIQNPVTDAQAGTAYDQTQVGLDQQQAFVQALNAQNGIQNQSDVYNQLQGVIDGTGPNPAQAQLANATAANTANQASLMAGQRGAAANPGLIARQVAMQGAANQQNAIGQGAALQAQQSLGAMNTAGNLATQQVGQQAGAVQGYNQAAQGQQQNLLNAIGNQNNANVGMQSNINNANAGMAQTKAQGQANMFGSLMGAAGTAAGMYFGGPAGAMAGGAAGKMMAGNAGNAAVDSGQIQPLQPVTMKAAQGGAVPEVSGPRSTFGKMCLSKGGAVPALVSPGEKYLDPSKVAQVAQGANPMQVGETIPGKAKVDGAKNSYANDTVPKTLESGGIVIPRSITQSANPEERAVDFVRAVMARQGPKRAS